MNPQQLIEEADRCVKCGLCLPHCPTYRLTRDEGDSPRGRIALIQARASGRLGGARLQRHLDRCLGCRLCEGSCPSGVRYGALLDGARALDLPAGRWRRLQWRAIAALPYRRWSGPLLARYRTSALRRLVRRFGGERLRRLDELLPAGGAAGWRVFHPAVGVARGRVGLFTGCIGRLSERAALEAAIRVLNRFGIEVVVPPAQRCCGALHRHNGDPARADRLVARNRAAFAGQRLDALLYLASGCGEELARLADAAPVASVSDYLLRLDWPERPRPLARRVLLHTPCSLRLRSGAPDRVAALLRRIPRLELLELPRDGCCGAAGSYLLTQPALADALRGQVRERIGAVAAEALLVSSNTGCALQLAAGQGREVLHPVQLLDRALRGAGDPAGQPPA